MASVLFVCTGNICRSPMAEGLLRDLFRHRAPGAEAVIRSSGVIAGEGNAAVQEAVEAASEREADISHHRARRLNEAQIRDADLVLGMALEHVDEVVRLIPDAFPKTFTLKELVLLVQKLPPPRLGDGLTDEAFRARIEEAHRQRLRTPITSWDLDVSDPLGMPLEAFRATAWEIDSLLEKLMDGLVARQPARTSLWEDE